MSIEDHFPTTKKYGGNDTAFGIHEGSVSKPKPNLPTPDVGLVEQVFMILCKDYPQEYAAKLHRTAEKITPIIEQEVREKYLAIIQQADAIICSLCLKIHHPHCREKDCAKCPDRKASVIYEALKGGKDE